MEQNEFKITLKNLEDELLRRLSSSGGDVLSDKNLVLNLEESKKTAQEIEVKVILTRSLNNRNLETSWKALLQGWNCTWM